MSCNMEALCNLSTRKMQLLVLYWLCLSCWLLAGAASPRKPVPKLSSQEMAGLQALWEAWKDHTPDLATNLHNWGRTSDPCGYSNISLQWTGVHCYNITPWNASVFQLTLFNLTIVGVLPPEISFLNKLQSLYLSYNNITGQLPDISNLTNLQSLYISYNNITGQLPDISNLTNLLNLYLSYNNITGQLPDISNLTNLQSLYLDSNNITGQLPDISKLTNLQYLNLSFNSFTSQLPDISNLTNLQSLDLSSNDFLDQLPNFSNLTKLYTLKLSFNDFTGQLPDIFNMTKLQLLDISFNNFTGQLPDISNLTNLQSFDLSRNNLIGHVQDVSNLNQLSYLDLSSNNFTGQIPNVANLTTLIYLDLSNNKFTSLVPNLISSLQYITTLNLSSNLFMILLSNVSTLTNALPQSLSKLYLEKNNIFGVLNISEFIDISLSNISRNLKVLSLQNNMISNAVTPSEFINAGQTKIMLHGNPYCNNIWSSSVEFRWCSIYCEQPCIYMPKSNNKWKIIVTTSCVSFAIILMLVILGFVYILHQKQKHIRHLQKHIKKADINTKWFEYNELRIATKNFSSEMKLGAGAYGAVYKGILQNNVVVAVKQLFLETKKDREDFVNEILLISNLQHRNLVTLKGYCLHDKQTLLIYEYIDNCDLDKILFSRHNHYANDSPNCNEQIFDWQSRLNVCQGVAQGLYYLHASSQSKIIHRDIKASNILLDKNLHPKIADFGLARPIEDFQSVILNQECAGTLGYLAPEYMCYGQLSDKVDVFSFGVLLLEIVSGKRNKDLTMPEDEVYLPIRVWKLHKENKIMDLKDATLHVSNDEVVEVQRVLEVAVLCVRSAPEKRPSMFLVVAMLAGNVNVDVSPIDENNNWPENFVFG